jgi:putative membrane-bound dehydrogenase-like protein
MNLSMSRTSLAVLCVLALASLVNAQAPPQVHDKRLVVELFAAAPDIVHPINLTFDKKGRLLVIESHSHFRPKDYKGPPHDRVRVLEDTDGDGKADRFTTFFEGTVLTMDIAAHPDGSVYLATRNEILRLRDTDGDGKADEKQRIVFLDTKGNYPHNGLSGLCFDGDGNLYFGMGENLGAAYKLSGADGTTLRGEGDGGHIFWCSADGTKLRRVATGFWNPFGLCRDRSGRLFAVDNDPDAMPPCRLLHVVEGGDYGFQFRYGRQGRHPFQAWNGELPGTLPMVSGTGEAPCEVLSYEGNGLPAEYRGDLLVTSWADHRVERYTLKPKGASFTAERQPFVQGGKDFRPVGLAVAPDGSLFFSDWILRDYNLHQRGAIWHLRSHDPVPTVKDDPLAASRLDPIAALRTKADLPRLLELLTDADPFVRHAAVQQLAHSPNLLAGVDLPHLKDARQRLGLLLAQRASGRPEAARLLPLFLADADEDVRFMAAKWIADEKVAECRSLVAAALQDRTLNVRMYRAYATALARLDGQEVNENKLAELFFSRLSDEKTPPAARAMALQLVPPRHPRLTLDFLGKLLSQGDVDLQREAVRALAEHPSARRSDLLLETARNPKLDEAVRAQAVLGLADTAPEHVAALLSFVLQEKGSLRDEALRALVNTPLKSDQRRLLEELARRAPPTRELVARVLGQPFHQGRPPAKDVSAWLARLDGPADADAGRRIFAQPRLAGCVRCHRAEGRGNVVGPNLSTIGRTERRPLLESILQPSNSIAPHYQAWQIETSDGLVRTGMLIHTNLDEYTYLDEKGNPFKVNTRDVVSSRPLPISIMPDGLADRFTDQELRDLLAYLSARR